MLGSTHYASYPIQPKPEIILCFSHRSGPHAGRCAGVVAQRLLRHRRRRRGGRSPLGSGEIEKLERIADPNSEHLSHRNVLWRGNGLVARGDIHHGPSKSPAEGEYLSLNHCVTLVFA